MADAHKQMIYGGEGERNKVRAMRWKDNEDKISAYFYIKLKKNCVHFCKRGKRCVGRFHKNVKVIINSDQMLCKLFEYFF